MSVWSEVYIDCLHMVQLMPVHHKTPSPVASFKSRLLLPFWYRLTQVVLEKRPLNGCSSSSYCQVAYLGNEIFLITTHSFVTVCTVYVARSTKRSCVRPFVRPSVCPVDHRCSGLLLSAVWAGDIDRQRRKPSPNRNGAQHQIRGVHWDGDGGNPAESAGFPRLWVRMLREYHGMDLTIVGFPRAWILSRCEPRIEPFT